MSIIRHLNKTPSAPGKGRAVIAAFLILAFAATAASCRKEAKEAFGISPASAEFGREGGSKLVNVTGAAAWTATVSSASPWCTIDKTSGKGNGTIIVTAAPNLDIYELRPAAIEVTDGLKTITVSVSQAAAARLEITPGTLDPAAAGAGRIVNVAVKSNGAWTVTPGQAWCKPDKTGGTGDATVTVTLDPNMSTSPRPASLTFAGQGLTETAEMTQKGLPLEVVSIAAGSFLMGSLASEPNRYDRETQHMVTLNKGFHIGKYEVTNAQYAAFLKEKGIGNDGKGSVTYRNESGSLVTEPHALIYAGSFGLSYATGQWAPVEGYDNNPVMYVTWYGAAAYADWAGGALPTEAQWEYVCRAGKSGPFGVGDGKKLDYSTATFNWAKSYVMPGGEYADASHTAPGKTTAAGSYPANAWGVCDMHGNVNEWCADWYDDKYGSTNAADTATDPAGPTAGTDRVYRGGYYGSNAQACRSAYRTYVGPGFGGNTVGFRIVFLP